MRYVKKYRSILAYLLIFAFIIQFSTGLTVSADFVPVVDKIYSEGVYMVNLDTDVVIYAKNENKRFYPASITKIMTAIVVLENCPDLDSSVRVGYDSTNEFWEGDPNKAGASNAAFEAGQNNLTYRDCLYALMLVSACEAANILALNLCGSIENFTVLMNATAKRLGCTGTHFSNTHGLWEAENYSTPYDMYLISRYAYDRVPGFMEICDTYSYDFPPNVHNPEGYTMFTTNQLIKPSSEFYLDYVHGIKTGSIDEYYDDEGTTHPGGRSLVTTARKNGYTYLLVTMQAPFYNDSGEKYQYSALDHYNLYEWAYKSFIYQEVISKGEICTELDVLQGEEDRIQLVADSDFTTIIPSDLAEDKNGPIQRKRTLHFDEVIAPVKKGEILGKMDIVYQGEVVKTVDLVAAKSIERSQIAYLADRAKSLTETSWFSPLLMLLIACILINIVLMAVRRRRLIQEARRTERLRRRKNTGR